MMIGKRTGRRLARFRSAPFFKAPFWVHGLLTAVLASGGAATVNLSETERLWRRPGARVIKRAAELPPPVRGGALRPRRSAGLTQTRLLCGYSKLPLSFEANIGQSAIPGVKFIARGRGTTLLLAASQAFLILTQPVRQSGLDSKSAGVGLLTKTDPAGLRGAALVPAVRSRTQYRNESSLVIRIEFVGANPSAAISGADALPGKAQYFNGSDPRKWRTDATTFSRVRYRDIYPGTDLIFYGSQHHLEFDFVVSPGFDPAAIRLRFDNAGAAGRTLSLQVDGSGDLLLGAEAVQVRFHKPRAHQPQGDSCRAEFGSRFNPLRSTTGATGHSPDAGFVLAGKDEVGIQVKDYDLTRPLVIDPLVTYATYLGGGGYDAATSIAVDSSGDAYVTGYTRSIDFPVTPGTVQSVYGGGQLYGDAFVTKLNAAGTAVVYSAYLGGSDEDVGTAIAVDSSGNATLAGYTRSSNFPATPGAFRPSFAGGTCGQSPSTFPCGDAFVAKLNAAGNGLVYSTYLGGSLDDWAVGLALDAFANAYVTGTTKSSDFPTTPGALATTYGGGTCGPDPCVTGYLTKLSGDGSTVVYSTYLGGSGDRGQAVAVDGSGSAYVTGFAGSSSFPTTPGAFQTLPAQNGDAFVLKLKPDGSGLAYSTYLGGDGDDVGTSLAIDSSGNALVAGLTGSQNFPTTPGAFQRTCGGCVNNFHDAFATKLNATGSALIYSTLLGGGSEDLAYGVAVDSAGNAYLTGRTLSTDFPTPNALQGKCGGGCAAGQSDAFVAALDATGSGLLYSTYFGGSGSETGYGIALDTAGNAYVAGVTTSSDLLTTAGAVQTTPGGSADAFLAKIGGTDGAAISLIPSTLTFTSQPIGTTSLPQAVTVTNLGTAPLLIASISTVGDFSETHTCGTSVAAGAGCAIDVTFTPTATGVRSGTLTISDNAIGSPQTVGLSGGSAAAFELVADKTSAAVIKGADSAGFTISTPSPSASTGSISLACAGNAPARCTFNPVSIVPGQSAALMVSNLTAVTGNTLTFSVTGTSGSESASLSLEIMLADFSLSISPGASTLVAGQTATGSLALTPLGGFDRMVSLACSGAPPGASCSVSPLSLALNGATVSTATVTLTTTVRSTTSGHPTFPPTGFRGLCFWFGFFVLTSVGLANRLRARAEAARTKRPVARTPAGRCLKKTFASASAAVLALLALALASCGGGPDTPRTFQGPSGTPAGTYSVSVTGNYSGASSGTTLKLTHAATLTLTVN